MAGPVSYLNRIFTELTTVLLIPFRSLHPLAGAVWLSVLAGLCMILIFRWLTDQEAISELRRRMGAEVLGMLIYISSPGTVLRMAGRLLRSNLRYLVLILRPLVVIAIPFAVLLGQLDARYSRGIPSPGEDITVTLGWAGQLPSRGECSVVASNATVLARSCSRNSGKTSHERAICDSDNRPRSKMRARTVCSCTGLT